MKKDRKSDQAANLPLVTQKQAADLLNVGERKQTILSIIFFLRRLEHLAYLVATISFTIRNFRLYNSLSLSTLLHLLN